MKKTHSCFVIMPFCETEHGLKNARRRISEAQWAHIYERWIKRSVESYKPAKLVCKRSPRKPGSIIKGIIGDLANADLVVADLTGARPNVYYELGVRHAIKTGTIIITQDLGALPSDLGNYFVFSYDYSEKDYEYDDYYARFEKHMHDTIQLWNETDDPSDNPVSDFLGVIDRVREKTLDDEKQELKVIYGRLKKYFAHNFEVCETLMRCVETDKPPKAKQALVIDVFPIESVFARLTNYNWNLLRGYSFGVLEDLVINHRRLFSEVAATMRTLEMNPEERGVFYGYFVDLLKQSRAMKMRFDAHWDTLAKTVDSIRIVKAGTPRRHKQ